MVGSFSIDALSNIVANVCILGVRGISASDGITSPVLEEASVNRKMIQQTSGSVIVVTESKKIGRKDRFFTSDINSVTHLITDKNSSSNDNNDYKSQLKEISASGVEVIMV